jgi:hypothetical protein
MKLNKRLYTQELLDEDFLPFADIKQNMKELDYRDATLETKPDIIFSSLFCHHFTEQQLVYQFQWMKEHSETGFFINDLQRHPLAYYSIKMLTSLFSKSYLVKNDAPLSVARGFVKKELIEICRMANIRNININWKWAFRYLLVLRHV